MKARIAALASAIAIAGCAQTPPRASAPPPDVYGTLEPFAANSIYFVMTDRFVDGDPSNDHRDQGKAKGAAFFTFDRPVPGAPPGRSDNVGYLGGDFKGIVDNAGYIRGMGFTAVWVTPIVDNPDEAFTGGDAVKWGGMFTDRGKTGYHGYWGDNFYVLDEHWSSPGLDFRGFTDALHAQGLKVVLDIVCNHGSPAFSMPKDQPKFGKIYDADWKLLADEQNLPPAKLDPAHNPLHAFYNTGGNLVQLSDLNENNPAVLDYLAGAYLQWIGQGADAFRIDTIGWMPDAFWKRFVGRIRAQHPGFFMFGEDFDYDADKIAHHTYDSGGAVSVLDFPLKAGLAEVFGSQHAGFERLSAPLHLAGGPYANPYDLVTFYDNHDMARLDADDNGFIDANNWLFTARGIPAVYYGSETGFERGHAEHMGNRNYFGQERVDAAPGSPIYQSLKRIAHVRAETPALQRGLQVVLELQGDRAAFYRVLQHDGTRQIALVLLNKGDAPARFDVRDLLEAGQWREALTGATADVAANGGLASDVPAHGVRVWLLDGPVTREDLRAKLAEAMAATRGAG